MENPSRKDGQNNQTAVEYEDQSVGDIGKSDVVKMVQHICEGIALAVMDKRPVGSISKDKVNGVVQHLCEGIALVVVDLFDNAVEKALDVAGMKKAN